MDQAGRSQDGGNLKTDSLLHGEILGCIALLKCHNTNAFFSPPRAPDRRREQDIQRERVEVTEEQTAKQKTARVVVRMVHFYKIK